MIGWDKKYTYCRRKCFEKEVEYCQNIGVFVNIT